MLITPFGAPDRVQDIGAVATKQARAIGLSGLLVKSTLVMRDDLAVLNERGLHPPVILGGAALTRRYVEQELQPLYNGPVFYAKDAFDALDLMRKICSGGIESASGPPARIPRAKPPSPALLTRTSMPPSAEMAPLTSAWISAS